MTTEEAIQDLMAFDSSHSYIVSESFQSNLGLKLPAERRVTVFLNDDLYKMEQYQGDTFELCISQFKSALLKCNP